LQHALRSGLWAAASVQQPGSRPLEFEGAGSLASRLVEWPADLTVACQCHYHPDDLRELREAQERNLLRVAAACRAQRRELLIGIIAGSHGELREDSVARVLRRLYELDIRPDWWALEPQPNAGWQQCAQVIAGNDAYCRGILISLEAAGEGSTALLALAARTTLVRGFVAGRSMFAGAAAAWLAGQISDEALAADITGRFRALVATWGSERSAK
jgi:5-dehydro-2-deoxygluconokinase